MRRPTSSSATPAVFCFHGLGQTAVLFCVNGAALDTKADDEGFILIMPNG
jgi:poly(3-hydroxybutyrate) depolymerase